MIGPEGPFFIDARKKQRIPGQREPAAYAVFPEELIVVPRMYTINNIIATILKYICSYKV